MTNLLDIKWIENIWHTSAYLSPQGTAQKNSRVFIIVKKKDYINSELFEAFYTMGISEMHVKKVNIFKDIKLDTIDPNVARFLKNSFIWED